MQNYTSSDAKRLVYSFDVFDTCITRRYAFPRDLFYDLGLRLAPEHLQSKARRQFATKFQLLRIRAEKKAHRHARPRRTVTIGEIYDNFAMPDELALAIPALIQAELALERESIYPIPAVVSYLDDLRQAGHRIIFISDMYLPAALLAPILEEHGVMKKGDVLYVSCDTGVTKHHGQLFRHVLDAEQLEPSQLIHTGDNPHADIAMAAKANIQANLLHRGMLTAEEIAMVGHRLPRNGGKSFLAALTRQLRLFESASDGIASAPLQHVVYGVVAPFLLAYVSWVLENARLQGIQRLYFVARDAEIMLRIAEALRGKDDAIELRYLYGSRRAWLGPSIVPGNTDWRRLLMTPGQPSSRHDITARMGLDETNQETLRRSLSCSEADWITNLSRKQANQFLNELTDQAFASGLVLSSAARERDVALSYFRQEGLFDDTPWALVDAGWSLNTQAALKRILDTSGTEHHAPQGYYLALHRDHLNEAQAGAAYPFVPKAGSIISRRRVVIEHFFLPSTHCTTLGYRREGTHILPVFGPELRSHVELAYAASLQTMVVSAACLAATDPKIIIGLNEYRSEVLSDVEGLLRYPRKGEADAISTFGTVADMRHEASFVKPLCQPLRFWDAWTILFMTLSKKRNFKSPLVMWLEGSTALSPWHVRFPLKLMLFVDFMRNRLSDLVLGKRR